jgi:hypothetical protein
MNVNNTYNFFEIDSLFKTILFWGMDLKTKKISITPEIEKLIKKMKLPFDEVIEIWDDESYNFYKAIYKAKRIAYH